MTIVNNFNDLSVERKSIVMTRILNVFPEKTLSEVLEMSEEEILKTKGVGRIMYDYIRTLEVGSAEFNVEQLKHMTYRQRLVLGQKNIIKKLRKFGLYVFLFCFCATNVYAFPGHDAIRQHNDNRKIKIGTASYYTKASCQREGTSGVWTASSEKFDEEAMTCAMWGVRFGTIIKVTNILTKQSIYVRVNDRGPSKRLVAKGRIIDLSKGAFQKLAELRLGVIDVEIEIQ